MMKHYSVMLNECIDMLDIKPNGIYVDGTLGRAGHSEQILKRLEDGHLYVFDLDMQAINESKIKLAPYLDKVTFIHDNYANIKKRLNELNIYKVDGILLDLGVSSPQFDDPTRGFSYRFDAKLDMRMNQEQAISAYDIINNYDYHELVRILFKYGEEKNAKLIARKIEKIRSERPIETTFELVDVIKQALPSKVLSKKGHPCKKSFQAIRIEVNKELESLEKVLDFIEEILNVDGTVAIITFHSLEDRIVKDHFKELSIVKQVDKKIPLLPNEIEKANFKLINKNIILATEDELDENSRSQSAKLRGIRRLK